MRLQVRDVTKTYRVPAGAVHALRGIDLDVADGETLAIVGESGCGKSTLARLLVGLENPDRGAVIRSESIVPMVFQDSLGALHPRRRIEQILVEPLLIRDRRWLFTEGDTTSAREIAGMVGLSTDLLGRYPHELSGGQRQRVNIGRALALGSKTIVLDEPISALDVSIQAQIINLLMDLQKIQSLSLIFISHDLSVVRHLAHRVAVLYLGRVVESGPTEAIFTRPLHPYTEALLRSDPDLAEGPPVRVSQGEPPSPLEMSEGCSFVGRCPKAESECRQWRPGPAQAEDRHFVECRVAARNLDRS